MDISAVISEFSLLSIEERICLVEALWDNIADEPHLPPLTEPQLQELKRRLADHEGSPDKVVPWDEVRAQALARAKG